MTRKLKITPGKWSPKYTKVGDVCADNGAVIARVQKLGGLGQMKHDADFIAEAGTVANETQLMPRDLLAQRDALLAVLADAVALYGQPGGPWNVPSDPGGWLERARAAIARVRGEK